MRRRMVLGTLACATMVSLRISPVGAESIQVHGIIDLTVAGRGAGFEANKVTRGDSPLDPWGVRIFGEGKITPKLSVLTQVVLHDPSGFYAEGAYVMYTPMLDRDLNLMIGKIAFPIGTFAARSYSDKNPLIGKPLMYQHHTTLLWYRLPPSADALLAVAGAGQAGFGYTGDGDQGMPVVDDSYWDTGIVASGSQRPLEYAFGFTTGTPGWGNVGEEENRNKTAMGRLGVVPVRGVRLGVSGAYGAWPGEWLDRFLPEGTTANDYNQKLGMADFEFVTGHVELHSEGYHNTWEQPYLPDLKVKGGYVEGQVTVIPGVWLAARGEVMRFSSIEDSTGTSLPWDSDQDRLEAGVGYRPDKAARIKAVWQRNWTKSAVEGVEDKHNDVLALQLTVSF